MAYINLGGSEWIECENCGKTATDRHHIIFRSEARRHENLNDERNLLNVCRDCHSWFHEKKDRRRYLVIDRQLWELFPDRILQSKYE